MFGQRHDAELDVAPDQARYDAKRKGKNRVAVKALPFIRNLLSK